MKNTAKSVYRAIQRSSLQDNSGRYRRGSACLHDIHDDWLHPHPPWQRTGNSRWPWPLRGPYSVGHVGTVHEEASAMNEYENPDHSDVAARHYQQTAEPFTAHFARAAARTGAQVMDGQALDPVLRDVLSSLFASSATAAFRLHAAPPPSTGEPYRQAVQRSPVNRSLRFR